VQRERGEVAIEGVGTLELDAPEREPLHRIDVRELGDTLRKANFALAAGVGVFLGLVMLVLEYQVAAKPKETFMAALGLPDGEIDLFGLPCVIRDGAVRRRKDGRLAGSAAGLDQALRNLRAWRPSLAWHDLLHMPSSASRVIGCGDVYGRIAIGGSGDVVLLDADLNVLETWREGRSRFQATAAGK